MSLFQKNYFGVGSLKQLREQRKDLIVFSVPDLWIFYSLIYIKHIIKQRIKPVINSDL